VFDSADTPLEAGSEILEKAADALETDKAPDEKHEDTEQKLDSSNTDESEEIQGSSQGQIPNEEMNEKRANKDDDAAVVLAAQNQIDSEKTDIDDETGDFAQETNFETPAGKISTLKVTISAILITAVFSGFYFFDGNSNIRATSKSVSKTSEKRAFSKSRVDRKKTINPATPKFSSIYDAKIEEVTALRDSLLLKQEEVMRLKNQYREGIEELEKEISDELQNGISNTFLQAMENTSIAFALRTIQRRQAYIQQLESPAK